MRKLLSDRRLDVHLSARVTVARDGALENGRRRRAAVDEVLWVTQAAPQAWPSERGLDSDESGFVLVNDSLQSVSHPDIFAAGDIASMQGQVRPKAGVFAVRHGPVLAENLKRAANRFAAEDLHRAIGIPLADIDRRPARHRVARRVRGPGLVGVALEGLDRSAIHAQIRGRWRDQSSAAAARQRVASDTEVRCGGCGSKLGALCSIACSTVPALQRHPRMPPFCDPS